MNKLYILLHEKNHVAPRHLYKLFVYYVIVLLYRTRSLVSNRLPHADFEFERTLVVVWAVNEQASTNIKWAGSPIEAPILEVVNPYLMAAQRIYFASRNLHHKYIFLKVHGQTFSFYNLYTYYYFLVLKKKKKKAHV